MRRHGLAIAGVLLLLIGKCGFLMAAAVTFEGADRSGISAPADTQRYPDGSLRDRRGIRVPSPDQELPPLDGPPPEPKAPIPPPDSGLGEFSSNGERIYFTNEGHAGTIPDVGGAMGDAAGCADCHGEDGTGGRLHGMGPRDLVVPDIRYATLVTKRSEDGTTVPAWTDAQIADAIRKGVEPGGRKLNVLMPRFTMDTTDMKDLIGYLKELSGT
jgi:hypothetical protein